MSDNSVACKLFFTSLNEAVCKLDIAANTPATGVSFQLVLKNAAGNVAFKYNFARYFASSSSTDAAVLKVAYNQTVERQPISYTIP